jgi:hypothetical protein
MGESMNRSAGGSTELPQVLHREVQQPLPQPFRPQGKAAALGPDL